MRSARRWRNAKQIAVFLLLFLSTVAQAEEYVSSDGHLYRIPGIDAGPGQVTSTEEGFFVRLSTFYKADWTGKQSSSAAPARRALDSPLDSPPFPSSDWGYGGSPTIGVPDGNVYPLMSALQKESSRAKLYGWVEATVNASTSSTRNLPLSYVIYPNSVQINQAVLYFERLPDTVQKSHFDWGFHLTAFYGTDYRFTTSVGYMSNQLLKHDNRYGFDVPMEYLDLYFPVKEGVNLRIGRFISIPGIEAQLAPNNYAMTHSLLYLTDPFTVTGALATVKLSKQWMVQAGITAGGDAAPWSDDAKPSAVVCLNYSSATNRDNIYACANGINSGKYAYDNAQHYDLTWYHRFNAKWHMASEAWYIYQLDVPNVGRNVANPIELPKGYTGAFCAAGERSCYAPAYALVNYINREISAKTMIGFRSDMLDDRKGQRTGIPGKYTENTLFMTHYFGSTVMLRPEWRFDHSWDKRGYDNGNARNQFFFGADLIYKF
jgi:hypothetical protein